MRNITEEDMYTGTLSPTGHTVMGIYLCIIGIVSYIGNGLILFVFAKNGLFRQPPINMFIVSLVAGNLGESLLGFPFGAASNLARRWLFGKAGCNFYGFVCYMSVLSNMCTFVAISLYRYIVVCRPDRVSHLLTARNVKKTIAAVWAYAFLWALFPLLGWGGYGPEPYKTTCSLDWVNTSFISVTYIISVTVFVLVLPLIVMTASYAAVLRHTRAQVSRIADGAEVAEDKELPVEHARHGVNYVKDIETRTSKIVAVTILLYVLSWIPYATFSLLSACGLTFPVVMTAIPTMVAKTQCAYTPIIYIVAHVRFRKALLELFGFKVPSKEKETRVALVGVSQSKYNHVNPEKQ